MQSTDLTRGIRLAAFIAANLQAHTARWTLSQWRAEFARVAELRSERAAVLA